MELDACVHHSLLELGAPPLCLGRLLGGEFADVERLDAAVHEDLAEVNLGAHLRQLESAVLERPHGLTEGGAILDVLQRPAERRLGCGHRGGGDGEPFLRQVPDEVDEALAFYPEQVGRGDLDIGEEKFCGVLAVEADFF